MEHSFFYRNKTCRFVKKLWFFSVFLLFSWGANAQCPSGSVTLNTQAQVNAFLASYPNCTIIAGSLWIQGEDITDLSPLSNITKVNGRFDISNNSSLTNLNGLSSLTNVGRYLGSFGWEQGIYIRNNSQLTDISALSNLQGFTDGALGITITNNSSLSVCNTVPFFCTYLANTNTNSFPRSISGNATGCQNVSAVNTSCLPPCPTGNVTFQSQAHVNTFGTTYPNCTELPGNLTISAPVSSLTNLSPLSNLTKIGGNLMIDGGIYLNNLNGLNNLTEVGGNMKIAGSQLSNIQALSNLTEVGGYLEISGNKLQNLNGLDNLSQVGGRLHISDNTLLTNFNGLEGLTQIGGYLHIRNNPVLTTFSGLDNLTEIDGFIRIWQNNTLTDISALSNLDPDTILADSGNYVDPSGIIITNNPQLSNCSISSFCAYLAGTGKRTISQNGASCNEVHLVISVCNIPPDSVYLYSQQDVNDYGASNPVLVPGNLTISGASITDLSPLSSLTKIEGKLVVHNNSQLQNLNGLNNLTQIDGNIEILSNAQLNNLNGLSNVTQIDGNIVIQNNSLLVNIFGLENINPTGINQLKILSNNFLTSCDIDSFCQFLSLGNTADISGNATITGSTCSNLNAMQQRCQMTCPSGNVLFISQADVNHFANRFAGCTNASLQNLTIRTLSNLAGNSVPSDIVDLSPLNGIIGQITREMRISGSHPFTTLGGFESLTSVGSGISESYNENGFSGVRTDGLYIEETNLQNINGLNNLANVNGILRVEDNASLQNVNGFSSLNTIGRYLEINNNASLQNLNGFSSLVTLTRNLVITSNAVLSDISGLSNISQINQTAYSVGGGTELRGLTITNNPNLATCNLDVFCTYLHTTGARQISGNAQGCQNVNAIKDNCPEVIEYCSAIVTGGSYGFYITNVTFSGISNSTTGNTANGYYDYTSQIAEVTRGGNETLQVTIAPTSGSYINAFIDWNQDGIFQTSERYVVTGYTTQAGPFVTNISIPDDALLGQTRMRVILKWGSAPNNACDNIQAGEIEDYTINVVENNVTEPEPAGYCSVEATDSGYEYITGVTFSGIDNVTEGDSGYNDYTSQVAEVTRGGVETLQVTINADNNDYLSVFIDWNQDGEFDEVSETYILAEETNEEGPFTVNIAIPADAVLGQTRMRVMLNWGASPNPCEDIQYGEVEDYTINVTEIEYCSVEATDSGYEYITGVTFSGIDNVTEGDSGYNDYTSQVAEVTRGGVETLQVTINADNNDYLSVFIDWNRDGEFDEVSETYILAEETDEEGPFTMNIAIPADASLGQTRMRVMLNWGESPNPCENIQYGEVEDYTINVSESTGCEITVYTNSGWSNGEPTTTKKAIIESDLILSQDLTACELLINEGVLTVPSGVTLTVVGSITNTQSEDNFIVENGGVIMQLSDAQNQGNVKVLVNSNPMRRLDYTLWSAPVSGMLLKDFSEVSPSGGYGTLWNRVYTLGETQWNQVWNTQPNLTTDTTEFDLGTGYLFRSRNDYSPNDATIFEGEFIGVPNNGNIDVLTPNVFNAVGNPYPSPIIANDFINLNQADALYFWTNVNASNGESYEFNNWASYSLAGSVGVAHGNSGNTFFTPANNMSIQPGQGFVVGFDQQSQNRSVSFNNQIRTTNSGSFFREVSAENHRFRLNLSNQDVTFNQILVGYLDGATDAFDSGIDAKMFSYSGNAIYTIIEDKQEDYVIQGRALPFSTDDIVLLGFRAVNEGNYSISLYDFEGIFQENQDIYLKDNFTQITHNLKNEAYNFVTEVGVFNDRFEILYQSTMSVKNPELDNKLTVYKQDKGFWVVSEGVDMKEIVVYDISGRKIYNTSEIDVNKHFISNLTSQGVYILKVITAENQVISKKIKY